MTSVTTNAEVRQPEPAESCQPWCVYAPHDLDDGCGSAMLTVPLTLDVDRLDAENRELHIAATHNEGGTSIEIYRPDRRGYKLTPAEAAHLVENVQLLLDQIAARRAAGTVGERTYVIRDTTPDLLLGLANALQSVSREVNKTGSSARPIDCGYVQAGEFQDDDVNISLRRFIEIEGAGQEFRMSPAAALALAIGAVRACAVFYGATLQD